MWGADLTATFDYTSSSQWTAWGITAPSSAGKGVDLDEDDDYAFTVGYVTMTFTDGTSTPCRCWNKSGTLEFRFYSGSTVTFTVSSGYAIKSIYFNSTSSYAIGSPTGGSISSNTWTPKSGTSPTSVRLDASGSATLRNVIVTYVATAVCSAPSAPGNSSFFWTTLFEPVRPCVEP